MNIRLLKVRILTLAFVSLFLVGMIPQAVWAGEVIQQDKEVFPRPFAGYDLQNIYVFYDPHDEMMTGVAEGIEEIVKFRLNNLILIPVDTSDEIGYYLHDEPWIALYAFQSNLDGVIFSDREMSWWEFYQTLGEHRDTEHLVAMGNTLSLEPFLKASDSMIHTSEAEQIDGLLLILYGVWVSWRCVMSEPRMMKTMRLLLKT